MTSANLIVFIDALGYTNAEYIKGKVSQLSDFVELTPEQGYSSNQHVAIFGGMLPNDAGYFTDYTLHPKFSDRWYFPWYIRHNNFINFIIRKVGQRFGLGGGNIPIGLGGLFINNGFYPLESKKNLMKLSPKYRDYNFRLFDIHDEVEGIRSISKDELGCNEFFVINSLDHKGHLLGPEDESYKSHLEDLLVEVNFLIERFLIKNPRGKVALLSDHGMSNKPIKMKINLESVAGSQGKKTYFYFIDSSVLKVWCFNDDVRNKITNYLNGLDYGELLSTESRNKYGIGQKFADLVFVVDSSTYFEPQYFGFGLISKTNGMHGARPECKDQKGIFASNFKLSKTAYRNSEVFDEILCSEGFIN